MTSPALLAFGLAAALIAIYVIDVIATLLNIRALKNPAPKGFEEVYDAEKYAKMQAYTIQTAKLGLLESAFSLIILLAFWFLGGFEALDTWVRSLELGTLASGLIYIGLLGLAKTLLGIPWNLYDTFVIEERFGFNKTTVKTFIGDLIKSLILTVILGALILSIILLLFQHAGDLAWVYGWIATSIILLLMMYIAPAIIMPMFNKFDPLSEGELRDAIFRYAEKNKFPLNEISVMDGSTRSTKANAFFTGIGSTKKIVLFDTLIENHTTDELVAVLAHEIGHFKCKHIVKRIITSIAISGIYFFLLAKAMDSSWLYSMFTVDKSSIYVALVLFGIVVKPFTWISSLFSAMKSRQHEYEADRFAVTTTGNYQPLAEALKNLSKENLVTLTPHPFYSFLYHSHPSLVERVRAMKAVERS